MMNKVQTSYVRFLPVWLITLVLAQLLTMTTAYARAQYPAPQQKADACQISVPAGWRPYRVQAADNLAALATQASVDIKKVMQVNCLTTTTIEADDLLLLPGLTNPKTSASGSEQSQAATVAAAPANNTSAAVGQALITVISTTATVATAASAAPAGPATTKLPVMAAAAPLSSLTPANLIAIALFVLTGLAIFFFALRPRADDSIVVRNVFSTMGNAIFLFAGVMIGVILFPMVNVPSFTALPTGVSATLAVTLIGLLVAKELFFSGQQWRTLNRLLNLGIAPLLMIFFLTVATRVAEVIN